ncbi:MAG: hypothetical protein IKQ71_07245 [Lachnospiraceae bacterium]|nr:hypothetical protein [Lachnospiraceae bacterium]
MRNGECISFEGLSGNEHFKYFDVDTDLSVMELWQWYFSDLFDIKAVLVEYLVSKALGFESPYNIGYWTAHRLVYRGKVIDLRVTSYVRSLLLEDAMGSFVKSIDIRSKESDLYIFCMNTGKTYKDADPLNINNWRFYVIPTWYLKAECGKNKSIHHTKVQRLVKEIDFKELRKSVDDVIDRLG